MVEHTRTLDFKIAYAIGLGTMIAAGIFSLSGSAVDRIGSSAVIAFVIAAVIAGITAASYSEFASIYSENGGGYLFSSQTFDNDRLTYSIGMMLFLGYTGTTAFYLATMDEWFFRFVIPESLHFLPHGTTGVAAAILLGVLNARGTEESGTFQLLVTGAKVAVLFAFIGGAFADVGAVDAVGTFAGDFRGGPVDIISIAALAFITFFGFSAIAASAGEIIEPRKTVPRAIAASIITVTILYAFVIIAMVNVPPGKAALLKQGETAMGAIAAEFLGPIGKNLIVAGAIFSMVSASNASILAASGIGSLMGKQGQAPRSFSRIHPQYATPFWSVTTATATIVAMIALFIGVFPEHGGVLPFDIAFALPAIGTLNVTNLGLPALTGFATLNLLLPLSIVNGALIYSRRRFPDIERGFRVPGVPVVPILGILANLALITNLPPDGVVVGLLINVALVVAYLVWGGAPHVEELFEEVVGADEVAANGAPAEDETGGRYRVLVPIARPDRAVRYVRLASLLASYQDDDPIIQVLNITHVPDQTPAETVREVATRRVDRIEESLAGHEFAADYVVEGHICRDIAFDIIQTARDDEADQILMGYPEEHHAVVETVEYETPCDAFFVSGISEETDVSTVNIGAGGGPHHMSILPFINEMGKGGAEVHVISVSPEGGPGSTERPEETLGALRETPSVEVHNISAQSVAEGLVTAAAENGGILIIGATRTRRLRRWVFGSTPDRVIDLAEGAGVPVLVHASDTGLSGRVEDYVFPVYKFFRQLARERRGIGGEGGTSSSSEQ